MSVVALEKEPIVATYTQPSPNFPLELGKHRIEFEVGTKRISVEAEATLRFVPRDQINFVCSMDSIPPGVVDHAFLSDEVLKVELPGRHSSFEGAIVSAGGEQNRLVISPMASAINSFKSTTPINQAVFHLFNAPKFNSTDDYVLRTGAGPSYGTRRVGRIQIKHGGWCITLAGLKHTHSRCKQLEDGGYAITHMGELNREDNADFSSDSLEDILAALQFFLSFAFGRWAGVALPIGYSKSGEVAFEQWGLPICAGGYWNPGQTWFLGSHGEMLAEVFRGFWDLWQREIWQEPIRHALYWYLGANDRRTGIGVDTGLILAQTALEGLAWTYIVADKKLFLPSSFEKHTLTAADKVRLLITSLGIPTAIPAELHALHGKRGKPWEDGPEAITKIRNGLVHSSGLKGLPEGSFFDAWKLSMWYLDLILLRLCGYKGHYGNRLTRRAEWDSDIVPWG